MALQNQINFHIYWKAVWVECKLSSWNSKTWAIPDSFKDTYKDTMQVHIRSRNFFLCIVTVPNDESSNICLVFCPQFQSALH